MFKNFYFVFNAFRLFCGSVDEVRTFDRNIILLCNRSLALRIYHYLLLLLHIWRHRVQFIIVIIDVISLQKRERTCLYSGLGSYRCSEKLSDRCGGLTHHYDIIVGTFCSLFGRFLRIYFLSLRTALSDINYL